MSSFVISYDRENKAIAKNIADEIGRLGHTVWVDLEVNGGQVWWDEILKKIRECDVLLYALSPETLNSIVCKREYHYAAKLGKPILPVLITDRVYTDFLPPLLLEIQYVDYRKRDREAAERLGLAITKIPSPRSLPDPLPATPEIPASFAGSEMIETDKSAIDALEPESEREEQLLEIPQKRSDVEEPIALVEEPKLDKKETDGKEDSSLTVSAEAETPEAEASKAEVPAGTEPPEPEEPLEVLPLETEPTEPEESKAGSRPEDLSPEPEESKAVSGAITASTEPDESSAALTSETEPPAPEKPAVVEPTETEPPEPEEPLEVLPLETETLEQEESSAALTSETELSEPDEPPFVTPSETVPFESEHTKSIGSKYGLALPILGVLTIIVLAVGIFGIITLMSDTQTPEAIESTTDKEGADSTGTTPPVDMNSNTSENSLNANAETNINAMNSAESLANQAIPESLPVVATPIPTPVQRATPVPTPTIKTTPTPFEGEQPVPDSNVQIPVSKPTVVPRSTRMPTPQVTPKKTQTPAPKPKPPVKPGNTNSGTANK